MNEVKRADSREMRNAIFRLEDLITSIPGNGLEESGCETVHRFGAGTYAREMIVPQGVFITGMVHKTEHLSIFLEGSMLVAAPGGESIVIEAPIVEIGQPGIKRAGYTLTRVRWITVHATEETDLEKLEAMLLTNDPEEAQVIIDQQDYLLTKEPPELLEKFQALPYFELESDEVEIRPSPRHGLGVFAKRYIYAGEVVAPGILAGTLTAFSRYMNHGAEPNVEVVWMDDEAFFLATRDIVNEEVLIDYRTTLGVNT